MGANERGRRRPTRHTIITRNIGIPHEERGLGSRLMIRLLSRRLSLLTRGSRGTSKGTKAHRSVADAEEGSSTNHI